ncbi:hypothetical protein PANT_19c00037 [Moesziomyces antarcticus T-34]|uniref:Uncharacterized protein n=1 Tax=Pseudozyma antarctica (strain T-34) TaxID=1151754 RepID=M9MF77_PSEA3|nr:hypothetical protein PANT_19c00037 [Moesziomyces antarcticus T-34]
MSTTNHHRLPPMMTPHEQYRPTFPLPGTAENRRDALDHFPGLDEDLEVGFKVAVRACGKCKRSGKHCTFGTGRHWSGEKRALTCDLCAALQKPCNAKGYVGRMTQKEKRIAAIHESLDQLRTLLEQGLQSPHREEAIASIERIRKLTT